MKKLKNTLTLIMVIAILAICHHNLGVFFSSAYEQDQIHVSSLFYPREGEGVSQGDEHAAQASKDILPPYLHEYENSGALLNIHKNTNKTSAIQTKKFSIADNTENDLLIRMRPTPDINKYQTMIKGKGEGGNDIPADVAYGDTSYWPTVRDITLTIRDAYHPDIFIEVYWSWRTKENATYRYGNMTTRANNQKWGGERGDNIFREGKQVGALVPVSYWGNLDDIMEVYYDAAENKIYTIQCDIGGAITGKKLLRDFNSTYDGKDVAWGGFKSGFVTMDIQFAGGAAKGYVVLVTDIDGLNLETDSNGLLLTNEIEEYNGNESSYEYELEDITYYEGIKSYALPMIKKTNLLTSLFEPDITEQFFVTILDNNGCDVTSSAVTGLNEGKWTKDALFMPLRLGNYSLMYYKDDILIDSTISIKESRSVYDIFHENENIQFAFNQSPPHFMLGQKGLGLEIERDTILQLKNPIKLSNLNESVPLISYLVTPKTKKDAVNQEELNTIIFTLTDASNPDKYIKIKHSQSQSGTSNSYVNVAANGQVYGGIKQNLPGAPFYSEAEMYGTALDTVFTGVKSTVTDIYYYSNKITAGKDFYNPSDNVLIRDFNNPDHLLPGDEAFEGFGSNYVYLTIEFVGVKQKTGVILYTIAGQKLIEEFIFEDIGKELSEPVLTFEQDGDNLRAKVINTKPEYLYQFWIKHKVNLGFSIEKNVWILKNEFSSDDNILLTSQDVVDDLIEVIVKIKNDDTDTVDYEIYKSINAEHMKADIKAILINGNHVTDEGFLIEKGKAEIEIITFANNVKYDFNGVLSESNFYVHTFNKTGLQTFTVGIYQDGVLKSSEIIQVNVFDPSLDYVVIKDVIFSDSPVFTVTPVIEEKGQGISDYSLKLQFENEVYSSYDGVFNPVLRGYGNYYYKITIEKDGNVIDTYQGYYNHKRPDKDVTVRAEYPEYFLQIGESVQIKAITDETGLEDVQYAFFKKSVAGTYLIKNWGDNVLNFIGLHSGVFLIQIRVKADGADCFEHEAYVRVNVEAQTPTINNLTVTSLKGHSVPIARSPQKVSVESNSTNSQYEFYVIQKGYYKAERYFSPIPGFIWIPNKAGEYTIEVRAISQDSFGYGDNVKSFKVTVYDYYTLEIDNKDVTIILGETSGTEQIQATIKINGKEEPTAKTTWESDNLEIVIVDENGLITAIKEGNAVITVQYIIDENYIISQDIAVTVLSP